MIYSITNAHIIWFLGLAVTIIAVQYTATKRKHKLQARALNCEAPTTLYPGISGALAIIKAVQSGKLVEHVASMHENHGHTFKEVMIGHNLISTIEPENLKALIATQFNHFGLGIRHRQFYPLLGDGIFTLDGSGWSFMRALIRPQFAREQIADLKLFDRHLAQIIRILPNDGSSVDIQEIFYLLTIDSATDFLFGESTDTLSSHCSHSGETATNETLIGFASAFNTSQRYLLRRTLAQQLYWTINPREFREANAAVHKFVDHYVCLALLAKQEGIRKGAVDGRYIFLQALASETNDPKIIRDNLLNILLAGRDTTASLLSSVFYFLARNARVWSKLRREVTQEFGDSQTPGKEITLERLKDLAYLRYVLNEALRLLPPVPVNFREALQDTSLPVGGGTNGVSPIHVAKGDIIAYNVYAMHRRTDIWGSDAHVFRPERWEESRPRAWKYLPFNGGPRICLGQQYALVEASYVTVRMLQEFDVLENADSNPLSEPRLQSNLVLAHRNGVYIKLFSSLQTEKAKHGA